MSDSAEEEFGEDWRLIDYVEKVPIDPTKQLGLRVTRETNRVTMINSGSSLTGLVFVGDRVVAVDETRIGKTRLLQKLLKEGKTITVEHGLWSHSLHRCTTIGRDKDSDKLTGRAINIYLIEMFLNPQARTEAISQSVCDFHVRYDARERLCVSAVEQHSLAAVHLRPGDIIRQVNRQIVASKTMLRYHLISALQKEGRVELLVEAGGGERTDIEMAPDVLVIAEKQKQLLSAKKSPKALVSALAKPRKEQKKVSKETSKEPSKEKFAISIAPNERKLINIPSDYDTLNLRPVKSTSNKL